MKTLDQTHVDTHMALGLGLSPLGGSRCPHAATRLYNNRTIVATLTLTLTLTLT